MQHFACADSISQLSSMCTFQDTLNIILRPILTMVLLELIMFSCVCLSPISIISALLFCASASTVKKKASDCTRFC